MARPSLRLPQNVPGDVYVDSTCIDCDTCRQLVPSVFARDDGAGRSYVARQPTGPEERERALMALVACPTASIGTVAKADTAAAARRFPLEMGPDVFFCGYTAEETFGAWAWLLRRPEGNVLVDAPRAATALMDRVEALGGVRWMFLTHGDDVGSHATWHERFRCERVMHADDVTAETSGVERKIEGREPVALADGLLVVPVPGHTAGSAALLSQERDLFSGDHVWGTDDGRGLSASRAYCWWSWPEQIRSMERLAQHRFTHVWPGHGPVFHADSPEAMRRAVLACATAMRGRATAASA